MTRKSIIGWIIVVILIIGAIIYYVTRPLETVDNGEVVACTMDAFMCPDGSYVGRTGPDCEFVCPNVQGTSTIDVNAEVFPADIYK